MAGTSRFRCEEKRSSLRIPVADNWLASGGRSQMCSNHPSSNGRCRRKGDYGAGRRRLRGPAQAADDDIATRPKLRFLDKFERHSRLSLDSAERFANGEEVVTSRRAIGRHKRVRPPVCRTMRAAHRRGSRKGRIMEQVMAEKSGHAGRRPACFPSAPASWLKRYPDR